MLAIRMSSPLFRLTTEQSIIDKVSFLNASLPEQKKTEPKEGEKQQLGLLVMKIDDNVGKPVDDNYQSLMIIFNTRAETQSFSYNDNFKEEEDASSATNSSPSYQLHPIQKNGADDAIKQSQVTPEGFTVPPLSSVVFVKPRS